MSKPTDPRNHEGPRSNRSRTQIPKASDVDEKPKGLDIIGWLMPRRSPYVQEQLKAKFGVPLKRLAYRAQPSQSLTPGLETSAMTNKSHFDWSARVFMLDWLPILLEMVRRREVLQFYDLYHEMDNQGIRFFYNSKCSCLITNILLASYHYQGRKCSCSDPQTL